MTSDKFIGSITNKVYNQIRKSSSDAEARRCLKEHLQQFVIKSVGSSFSIGFAEYIAKKHYKLVNFIGKIHYWGNGESYKTSEQLLKDYKETIT